MSIQHQQTTPVSKSKSSRSLIHSPALNRRDLTYGSSTKSASRKGYGIVSAAGLNAWRRGPVAASKRGSTSTANTSTSANVNVNDGGSKRKGPGMGFESTPGRKKFQRFSKASKPSIGTQSTPKTAKSRSTLGHAGQSGSADRTRLSELSSNMPSSVSSASTRGEGKGEDGNSFVAGAETIVGEDVFGLTVVIDPNGTLQGISQPSLRASSPPSSILRFADDRTSVDAPRPRQPPISYPRHWPSTARNIDLGPDWSSEEEQCESFAEMKVGGRAKEYWGEHPEQDESEDCEPRNESEDWEPETDDDLEDRYRAFQHDLAERHEQTIYWDLTAPIHDVTNEVGTVIARTGSDDFGPDFTYDEGFMTMLDDMVMIEHCVPLNDVTLASTHDLTTSDETIILRRTPRELIASRPKTPRRPTSVVLGGKDTDVPSPVEGSIEMSRGLNLSKVIAGHHSADPCVGTPDVDVSQKRDNYPEATSPLRLSPVAPVSMSSSPIVDNGENLSNPGDREVEGAERIRMPDLQLHESPWDASIVGDRSATEDPFGFKRAQDIIKRAGARPRRYRATSELETPPRPVPIPDAEPATSPTPSIASIIDDPSAQQLSKEFFTGNDSLPVRRDGGRRIKSLAVMSAKVETSDENVIVHDRVFHEPQYQGEAKRAKEARLAHYADLESNYALHVESGFF